jgi:hypothetical protein
MYIVAVVTCEILKLSWQFYVMMFSEAMSHMEEDNSVKERTAEQLAYIQL